MPQHRTGIDRHSTQVRGCCIQEHVACLECFCDEGLQCSIQFPTKNGWASRCYEHLSTRESDMLPRVVVGISRMPPKHKINTWEKVKSNGYPRLTGANRKEMLPSISWPGTCIQEDKK